MPVVPKRKSDLVDQRPSRVEGVSSGRWVEPVVPVPPRGWHKTALRVWESFAGSGQVSFWQSTDWAVAFSICEDLSEFKKQEAATRTAVLDVKSWERNAAHLSRDERIEQGYPVNRPSVPRGGSPQKMAEIYRVLGDLLVTESDRRRVRIELDASGQVEESDPVGELMVEYMDGLKG